MLPFVQQGHEEKDLMAFDKRRVPEVKENTPGSRHRPDGDVAAFPDPSFQIPGPLSPPVLRNR